jgi:hypothetical protein
VPLPSPPLPDIFVAVLVLPRAAAVDWFGHPAPHEGGTGRSRLVDAPCATFGGRKYVVTCRD